MLRKRKKSRVNLAVILMIFTSICLSTIQVGFSFLSQAVFVNGSAKLSVGGTSGGAMDMVLSSNAEFVETIDSSLTGNSYTTVIRASDGTTLNNYIKFGANADELWRIVGWTEYGIKIVKDQPILINTNTMWDSGNKYWVPIATNSTFPVNITMTTLEGCSTLCNYLNDTYYTTLIDPTSNNYINPTYINHTPKWDLTPMCSSGSTNPAKYPNGRKAGDVTCTATLTDNFKGLPIGILTIEEFCMVSTEFNFNTTTTYSTFTSGWLKSVSGVDEITLSERYSSTTLSKMPSSISNVFVISSKGIKYVAKKQTSGDYFRPAMYLKSNITLSSSGSGTAGSSTNPFIVTGVS